MIPASNRVVPINHNSPEYGDAVKALDDLEHTLKTANDFPGELEEKEQRIAEVRATKDLLEATRVRIDAILISTPAACSAV